MQKPGQSLASCSSHSVPLSSLILHGKWEFSSVAGRDKESCCIRTWSNQARRVSLWF